MLLFLKKVLSETSLTAASESSASKFLSSVSWRNGSGLDQKGLTSSTCLHPNSFLQVPCSGTPCPPKAISF